MAERILNGESVSALSNELKIKRSVLYRWRDYYREAARALGTREGTIMSRLHRGRGQIAARLEAQG